MSRLPVVSRSNSSNAALEYQQESSKTVGLSSSGADNFDFMKEKRQITDEQRADANRLKAVFKARQQDAKAQGQSLTQEDVAVMCEWSGQSAFGQYVRGEVPLNLRALLLLAKALSFDPKDVSPRLAGLIIGATDEHDIATASPDENGSPSEKEYALIPQYTARAAAGNGYHNDHVELTEGLVFKRDWLRRLSLKEANLCVIYAEGSSMEPTISDGEVLLIDRSDREPRNGKVYAFLRPDGSVSIKRIQQQMAGGWIIKSDNPDKTRYPDEMVSNDDLQQINIIGRSVWRGGGM